MAVAVHEGVGIAMLKITAVNLEGRRTLILEGRLVDPWLSVLEDAWEEERQSLGGVVIDLKDVTSISGRGKRVLREMKAGGAIFNCSRGVLTRHVVEELMSRDELDGCGKGAKR